MTPPDPSADARRAAYAMLTAVAVAVCAARIFAAENQYEPSRYRPPTPTSFGADRDPLAVPERAWPATRPAPTPMFSSNDRSRWATVRALVENGTYVVGRRDNFAAETPPFADTGIIFEDGFQSLDKVMNPATGEFYSSKPPLFATLVAGEYFLLYHGLGWNLDRDRFPVVIVVLLTVNVLPFAVYLVLLSRLVEHFGTTDFGRLLAFAAAALGTFVIPFANTLNNHSPAVFCTLFAVYPLLKPRPAGERETRLDLLVSGFFAGFVVTFELPAAAFAAGLAVPILLARRAAGVPFVLAAGVPVVALLAANYAAMGQFKPAYGDFGGPWYNYPGSHWAKLNDPVRPRGIDFNAEPTHVYAFHLLFGHHGWFSLTPVWVAAAAGLGMLLRRPGDAGHAVNPRRLAAVTVLVSAVVFAFYLTRTQSYNYGGNTSGPRWLIWLTPLWLLALVPAADVLARRKVGRAAGVSFLAASAVSVFYPAVNPWRYPWLQQLCEITGLARYG